MDSDRFDALLRLAEFWADRKEARQQIEWKVTLGLWAILVGAISLFLNHRFIAPTWLLAVVPVIHGLWLRGIWVGEHHNATLTQYWIRLAQLHVLDSDIKSGPLPSWVTGRKKWVGFFFNWSNILQLSVTVFMSFFLYALMHGIILPGN